MKSQFASRNNQKTSTSVSSDSEDAENLHPTLKNAEREGEREK